MHCGAFAFTSRREPEWTPGNLVVCDNRRTLQAATSIEAAKAGRVMSRTTVSGNPTQGGAMGQLVHDPAAAVNHHPAAACAAGRKAMVNTADAGDPERLVLFGSFTSSPGYKPMLFPLAVGPARFPSAR